jgi:3',5'-cyclic-AMP phosphodiesterase
MRLGRDVGRDDMRLAWLTDIHLDWLDREAIEEFARDVHAATPDVVLIGGDIGHARDVADYLEILSDLLRLPIFFVLGNHDYYGGSIDVVRAEVRRLARRLRDVTWLTDSGPVALTAQTALVGHDGWGDGGFGDAAGTEVMLNDFLLIEELRVPDRAALLAVLQDLGEEAARHFRTNLRLALAAHRHVVALTHVPPFREATWHDGRESDEDWLPFFACKAAGDAMRDAMAVNPDRRLTVLCGHTHGEGRCRPAPNIDVLTGGSEYGRPRVQPVIEIL